MIIQKAKRKDGKRTRKLQYQPCSENECKNRGQEEKGKISGETDRGGMMAHRDGQHQEQGGERE